MTDPSKPDSGANPESAPTRAAASPRLRPPARTANQSFAPGTLVADRYRIDAYLAAGGMGRVYRAHDLELDVPVALKTIRPEIASNPISLRRFKQEVLLARSVSHPNVCRIFDIGRDRSTDAAFLTMEFLSGETLTSRVRAKGPLNPEESLPLVRQMADALDAAHRAGIVHRDFKSQNVMLVPTDNGDRAVITDFGLAMTFGNGKDTALAELREFTTEGPTKVATISREETALDTQSPVHRMVLVGTPAYMSPEQVAGGSVGPASDLYALGVVLFEMCTGRLPFRGATPLETARAHLTLEPPRPSMLADVDDSWEQTILRLLSKEPADRYAAAFDAVLALEGRLADITATRHSLPAEHDAFVGRTTEVEALASYLEGIDAPSATSFLTLLGPAGTGKTRLAQKYGWDSLARWPGGVWFCDLSEARSVDGIAHAVATALNVPLGRGNPVVQLGHAIAGRGKSLVILDNFEQVVEHAEATLGHWLQRARDTRFLVTTRERLRLPEETTYEIEPLDPTTQGVELFDVRGQKHRPGFRVDASNRKQVTEIVQCLEGLPLAIELAASRLRMLGLGQLRDRLQDRFRVLAGGQRGRHATLEAALDWSWELLQPWEQSVVTQVSIFEGGFTLEAAEAVIDLSSYDDAPSVLDAVQSLLDKSWLRMRVALEAPRFDMYATVKDYASAKLHANDAKDRADSSQGVESTSAVEKRHGAFYGAMGTPESIDLLNRHGGVARRAALQLELDNLIAACWRAIARADEKTATTAYAAADVVIGVQGPFSASVQLGMDVIGAVQNPTPRRRLLAVLAGAEHRCGKMEEAHKHYTEALAMHHESGCRPQEAILLGKLGSLLQHQGRMEEAREHLEAAVAINREIGNRLHEGMALAILVGVYHGLGKLDEARERMEAALAIHREVGNRHREGIDLGNLGALYHDQGQMEKAREHFEAALVINRETGNRRSEGTDLGNLGLLCQGQGRTEEARKHLEAALTIQRELGNRRAEGIVLGNLGALDHGQGRMEQAREHYEAAIAIHREVHNRSFEGVALTGLGNLYLDHGRTEEGRNALEAGLAIHREVGHRLFEGFALGNLATFHGRQGRIDEARRSFRESLDILRELGEPLELAQILCSLAEFELQQADAASARAALTEAVSVAEHLGVTPESELVRKIEELRQSLPPAKTSPSLDRLPGD